MVLLGHWKCIVITPYKCSSLRMKSTLKVLSIWSWNTLSWKREFKNKECHKHINTNVVISDGECKVLCLMLESSDLLFKGTNK